IGHNFCIYYLSVGRFQLRDL
ncbi:hypothetical protein FOXB_00001, partial [Fusarium oxysporum f. sp. conglutinans Fo5176]